MDGFKMQHLSQLGQLLFQILLLKIDGVIGHMLTFVV